jgi:hypothetical protein
MITGRKIVGWLAVIAGLGVMAWNAYILYDLFRGDLTGRQFNVRLVVRGALFLAGAALVYFGFKRCRS